MGVWRSRQGVGAPSNVRFAGFLWVFTLAAGCGGRAHDTGDAPEAGGAGTSSTAGASASGGAPAATAGSPSAAGTPADAGAASEICSPGRAPLRRLTRAEYLKTLADLFGDVSETTAQFPQELLRPFPIGNLADNQFVSPEEIGGYFRLAKALAERATIDSKALAALAPCAATAKPDTACARTTIEAFASKAWRRVPSEPEVDELAALHATIIASGGDFVRGTRAVIAAILQTPDFLYRIEWGTGAGPRSDVRQLTGDEMATRLSYLFWGTAPDASLRAAAKSGALLDPDGIAKQASRLLDDPRSRAGLASFFDDFLELWQIPTLTRTDPDYYPALGAELGESTQRFLESQIFDHDASWQTVLTSNRAFVNESVSGVYGVSGITGDEWREVSLDPAQRLGLLTQPSVLMAGIRYNFSNPTERGFRIMEKILCRDVPTEPPDVIWPTDTTNVGPARHIATERDASAVCTPCHHDMDQLGFGLENFDVIGRYRTMDGGFDIDTKIDVTGLGPTNGPIELVKKLAALPETQACFAQRFAEFGLGKSLVDDPAGACLKRDIARRFEATGYNVRQLLLDLTQTDAFLYLPKEP